MCFSPCHHVCMFHLSNGLGQEIQALTYFPQLQFWQVFGLLCAFLMIQLAE